MADAICTTCGHQNTLGSNFCSSCGTPLATSEVEHPTMSIPLDEIASAMGEAAPSEPTSGDVPAATLLVRRGSKAGSRYSLDKAVTTLGRHPDSDIFLDDITVSRRHAEISVSDGGFLVRDVGSLNGTYLNRQRIETASLIDGDLLQVGKFKLMFVLGNQRNWTE